MGAPETKTWDAVIDIFAANNIPIKTIDRTSGFIATDPLNIPAFMSDAMSDYADCGRAGDHSRGTLESVVYNVVVRGDSARSSVRVTTLWQGDASGMFGRVHWACATTGKWEATLEGQIRNAAENRGVVAVAPSVITLEAKCSQQDSAIVSRDRTDAEVYVPNAARTDCTIARYCHYASPAVQYDKAVAIAHCRAEAATKR